MTAAPFVAESPAEQTLYNTMEFEIRAERVAEYHDNYQPEVHVTRLYDEATNQNREHDYVAEPHVRERKGEEGSKMAALVPRQSRASS